MSKCLPECEEFPPESRTPNVIGREDLNSRPPGRAFSLNEFIPERKVDAPLVVTRMEQWNQVAGHGVDSSEVGNFAKVAAVTCKREIVTVVGTAMLLRYNVFEVMK